MRLILQDDRNLVVYGFDGAAWASSTNTDEAPPPPPPVEEAAVARGCARRGRGAAAARRGSATAAAAAASAATSGSAHLHSGIRGHAVGNLERFYGDGSKYQRIADASGISNPDLIPSGAGADDSLTDKTGSPGRIARAALLCRLRR